MPYICLYDTYDTYVDQFKLNILFILQVLIPVFLTLIVHYFISQLKL